MNTQSLQGLGSVEDVEKATKIASSVIGAGATVLTTAVSIATAAVTSAAATGAAVGAGLTAFAGAASIVPVVGWIAAAVALLATLILKITSGQKLAKQLYKAKATYDLAMKQIREANAQADAAIEQMTLGINKIKARVQGYGLNGGLGATWFERTFFAKTIASDALKLTQTNYALNFPQLEAQLGVKIIKLKAMEAEMKRLQAQLDTGKTAMAGGIAMGILSLLVLGGLWLKNKKTLTTT